MKKMIVFAALATVLLASNAARSDYDRRVVGSWITSASEDRFGDGGTYTAITVGEGYLFAVRCLSGTFSYAARSIADKPRKGELYKFKFRVDGGKIYHGAGLALGDKIVQVMAAPALASDLTGGKELAIRQEVDGVTETHVVKLRNTGKALADLIAKCPLDKQPVPKFDDDGNIDPDSLTTK